MARLGDFCTKQSSNIRQSDLDSRDGSYPIYGASGFIKTVDFYEQTKPYVAVVKDGAGIGRVMKLPAYSSVIGTMQYIIPNDGVDVGYLAYAMEHMKLEKYFSGATIPHIYFKDYCKETMKEVSVEEQKQIVYALDLITSLISLRKKQLQKLDDLVKSRFVEMFGDPLLGEIKWPIHTVGDVADAIDPQPSHRTPPIDETGIPYVSIKDCDYKTGTIDFEHARKVSRSVLEEHLQRYKLNEGDFIIGKIGTIGNPIFVPARKDYTLSANIVLIQPYKQKASPYFLIHSFMTSYVDKQFEGAKNSTSQAAFGIQKVRMIKIPNPPIELQYQFETFVKKVDKSKLTVQQGLDKLELLKQSLMQKYFG